MYESDIQTKTELTMNALKELDPYSRMFDRISFAERCCCLHRFRQHVLMHVYSGTLNIISEGQSLTLQPGRCAFIAAEKPAQLTAIPDENENVRALLLTLPRSFLCEFFYTLNNRDDKCRQPDKITLMQMPLRPETISLFQSLTPYYEASEEIPHELFRLKMAEAVYALLNTDNRFSGTLFDFAGADKLDIFDVLNGPDATVLKWRKTQKTAHPQKRKLAF